MYVWLIFVVLLVIYSLPKTLFVTSNKGFRLVKKKILFILIVHLVASCTKVDSKCTLVSRHKSIYGLFHRFYILFVVFVITFFLLILYMAIFIMNRLQKGRCHPIAYINVIPLIFFFFWYLWLMHVLYSTYCLKHTFHLYCRHLGRVMVWFIIIHLSWVYDFEYCNLILPPMVSSNQWKWKFHLPFLLAWPRGQQMLPPGGLRLDPWALCNALHLDTFT